MGSYVAVSVGKEELRKLRDYVFPLSTSHFDQYLYGYSTDGQLMTLLSVRSVRVMLLDVDISLAAVLRYLSTRRPHLR